MATALCATLAGCSHNLHRQSLLCVQLPASHVTDLEDWGRAVIAGVGRALGDIGYSWSTQETKKEGRWLHAWYIYEPRHGSREPRNQVALTYYYANPARRGKACDVRVDVYHDRLGTHTELDWRAYFLLRDEVLPSLMPEASVEALVHPGHATLAWDIPALAERVAPGEALPPKVRKRVEAYEARSAIGRWWERTAAASKSWVRGGLSLLFWTVLYFLFPLNWAAFAAFALLAWLGRKLVKSPRKRTVGFVALAVLVLMPVKVPTLVGQVYLPHGLVQTYDFDPRYYARGPRYALGSALLTGGVAWLVLLRLRRRREGEPEGLEESRGTGGTPVG